MLCYPGSVSRHRFSGCPPYAESPFAPSGRYPSRCDVYRPIGRHYPPLIAHTGSCARPTSSDCLRPQPRPVSPCRLSPVPAGRWPFPALSPQSLYGCLDPYPAAPLRCTFPFLPEGLRPHLTEHKFGAPDTRRNATSTTQKFSRLQSFRYVQAPILARPPDCTHP